MGNERKLFFDTSLAFVYYANRVLWPIDIKSSLIASVEVTMDKKRLLLVDDVILFLQLGKTLLSRKNLHVDTASSGFEALKKAMEAPPNIIFLDLYMPDLNGDEVCRKLKAYPQTSSTPIVMVSSAGDEGARNLCLAAGCDDFITKPIQLDVLNATLERHLQERVRRYPRAIVNVPCEVWSGDEKENATILSLSPYGAFARMSPPPLPGKNCILSFTLPGSDENILIDAQPRWKRKVSEDSLEGSGFEFEGLSEEHFDSIARLVTAVGGSDQ